MKFMYEFSRPSYSPCRNHFIHVYRINKLTGATEKKRLLGGGLTNELKRDGWKEEVIKGVRQPKKRK